MLSSISVFGILLLYTKLGDFIAHGVLHSDVGKWITSYLSSTFCDYHNSWVYNDCVDQIYSAIEKGEELSNNYDIRAAVQIIHIYTWPYPETYLTVNALMRGDSNDHLPKNEQIFKEYVNLLKDSHDLLCEKFTSYCKRHNKVFRGQQYIPTDIGSDYTFKSFVSTSKKMTKAQEFAKEKMIFTIKEAYGLSLERFTAVSGEDEILVKPPLKISNTVNLKKNMDENAIEKHIRDNNGDDDKIPERYIEGSVRTSQPSNVVTSHVNNGPRVYRSYCSLLVNVAVTFILFLFFK